jgi:predicted ATPase/DNA-binding SARP family transcriptional activator
MAELEIRILGPLEIVLDGRRLPPGGRKQRSLLAVLALQANRVVSTDTLMSAVWGSSDVERSSNTLHVHIHNLRRLLAAQGHAGDAKSVLLSQEPGYVLQLDPDSVDALRFERLVASARRNRHAGDMTAAAELYRQAEECWRGTALADLIGEPFAATEATRLENLRLYAVEERIDVCLALRQDPDLVGELEALIIQHPLREGLRAQLMTALYRNHRQAEALRVFSEIRTLLQEELGIDPGSRLQQLELAILNQSSDLDAPGRRSEGPTAAQAATVLGPPSPLHMPLTSFVGRIVEVAQLEALVLASPLATLVGVGGSGKTRLALEVAARVSPLFTEGVFVVDLSTIRSPADVAPAVAEAFGLADAPIAEVAIRSATDGRHALVVLDNCEHVVEAVADVVALIVSRNGCHILATTRQVLGVAGEVPQVLEPMVVPGVRRTSLADIAACEGVQLFVDRARTALSSFVMDEGNASAVADVVRAVDGLPLAIEMVAARIRTLSPVEMAERLHNRLQLLALRGQVGVARQRTLRATLDWSYELLSGDERALFQQLGVFAGSWALQDAEGVCALDDGGAEVIDLVGELVAKSLVAVSASGTRRRFRLLETLRQYALEKLEEFGSRVDASERHATYFRRFARRCAAGLVEEGGAHWVSQLDDAHQNLMAASVWFLEQGDGPDALKLFDSLTPYWWRSGRLREAQALLQHAVDATAADASPARARAMATLASCRLELGDVDSAIDCAREAADAFGELGLAGEATSSRCILGRALGAGGDITAAESCSSSALDEFRARGDDSGAAIALRDLGVLARERGDREKARRCFEEGLVLFQRAEAMGRESDHTHLYARQRSAVLAELGGVARAEGDLRGAEDFLHRGLDRAIVRGNLLGALQCLIALAGLHLQQGNPILAATLIGATKGIASNADIVLPMALEGEQARVQRALQAQLDGEDLAKAVQSGRLLSVDGAAANARAITPEDSDR